MLVPRFLSGPHSGTLFWAEFKIILTPDPGQTLTSTLDLSTEYNLTNTGVWDETGTPYTFTPNDGFTYIFTPELGPFMIAIFMISTLAVVILSKNRISKKTRARIELSSGTCLHKT